MNFSFAGLSQLLPNATNISYTSVSNSGNTTKTLSSVVTTPIKVVETEPSYGKYRKWETTIKIDSAVWLAQFPTTYPKQRDIIIVNGITYNVCINTDFTHLSNVYRLDCDYLEFQGDLKDVVSILQPSGSASPTGERYVYFTALASGISAAIEPREQQIREGFGSILDPEIFDVYLDNDVSATNNPSIVKAGALVQDQNGVQYDIIEVLDRERLDLKTHLIVEKKL